MSRNWRGEVGKGYTESSNRCQETMAYDYTVFHYLSPDKGWKNNNHYLDKIIVKAFVYSLFYECCNVGKLRIFHFL